MSNNITQKLKYKESVVKFSYASSEFEYNNFPMRPLGWLSPREFIEKYKSQ